ncbi:MAG: hypothetical protein E7051_08715 [Lentisphaerae bacterium]|nr:hypothetical protein [Lentisphaerota bacterium]
MYELVFTSAKAGLIPGRSGFCSVAWTNGMPQNLIALLENMSGYNALYAPDDPRAKDNPVCYSYQKVQIGRSQLRILSRIAFAGLDHTGRSNKIAHHIVLDEKDDKTEIMRMKHGPVSVFLNEKNFYTSWSEPPRLLEQRRSLAIAESTGLKADNWEKFAKDPRWAGYIADAFSNKKDNNSCFYVEYDNELHGSKNILLLIDEITRLMSPADAQEFTFNTCFSTAQTGCSCFLRAALPTCTALPAIRKFRSNELVSLITPAAFPEVSDSRNIIRSTGQEYTPDPVTLTMPSIKVPGKKGTPPPPSPGAVIDLSEDISKEPAVDNTAGRRLMICSIAAGGLFILIALLVLVLVISGDKKEPVPVTPVQVAAVEPEVSSEVKEVEKVEKVEPPPVKDVKIPEKKAEKKPAVKKPEDKKSQKKPAKVKKTIVLSEKEQYEFCRDFIGRKGRISLPASICGAGKIIVKLKKNWGKPLGAIADADLAKCMKQDNSRQVTVFAVKQDEEIYDTKPDTGNANTMTVTLEQKTLSIADSKNFSSVNYPDRFNLESVIVVKDGQKIALPIEFRKGFAQYVPRGQFNEKLVYEPSKEEDIFKEQFAITLNDHFPRLGKWNKSVEELINLKKQVAALKEKNGATVDLAEFTQHYKDVVARLNEKKYKDAKAAFGTFLSLCDKVSDNDMDKFITRNGKGAKNFSEFIHRLFQDLDDGIVANGPQELTRFPYSKVKSVVTARGGRVDCTEAIAEGEKKLKELKDKLAKDGATILGILPGDFKSVKVGEKLEAGELAKLLNGNIEYYAKREVK